MGAPGYFILCPKGHEIGVIEDDLFWDENLEKNLEELKNKECPICGQKAKYSFCHYGGDVNDCVPEGLKLKWDGKENRWIIPKKFKEEHEKWLKNRTINGSDYNANKR